MKKAITLTHYLYRHHFVRYLCVGGTTFLIDLLLLVFLHGQLEINLLIAASISYWVSIAYNFLLNRRWVFNAQETRRLHEHAFLYGCLLAANYLYTIVALDFLSMYIPYQFAKIVVIVVAVAWTYPTYKRYIFYTDNREVS